MSTLSEAFVTIEEKAHGVLVRRSTIDLLEGQYVLKDIILVAAGMVIAAGTFRGGRLVRDEPGAPDPTPAPPATFADEPDASHKRQSVS